MADPQPQSTDQGFLPGLLGKVRDIFGTDPQAAYGGLLSDEATRRAFAWRELGAAAGAFSQGAMPVPYKGGIPFGATLGAAGAAASTAGDALMHARLEAAQAGLANQTVEATRTMMPMYQALFDQAKTNAAGSGTATAGTGTGTSGTALTGPAKIIADSKGTVFDTGDPFLNLVAHHESGFRPNIGWGDTDLSGYKLNANGFPDWPGKPGPQGNSTAAGLFQITGTNWNKYAPPLIAAGVMKPDFSPESQIAVAKSMMAANGKSDWLPYNPALAAAYNRGDVVKVPGSAASPQTAGPPTATQPPAPTPQQTANGPPTGLLAPLPGGALPPGSEGATPGPQTGLLAPRPPGAGPIPPTIARNSAGQPYQPIGPGGAVAAGTPGAGPVITPQQAAAANAGGGRGLPVMPSDYIFGAGKVAPPGAGSVSPDVAGPPQAPPGQVSGLLSPAAVAIAQGIARQQAGGGLPPGGAVAGPGAPSEPPAVAPADAAAARAAVMGQEGGGGGVVPGLMTPQAPAAPAGPPAGPPVASPFPPVGPPPTLPAPPTQMPPIVAPQMPQPTPAQAAAMGIAGISALIGKPAPEWIQQMANMPGQQAMEAFKTWYSAQTSMMTAAQAKQLEIAAAPYLAQIKASTDAAYKTEALRPGGGVSVGGQPPAFYAPESITAYNPATQRMEHAIQTKQPNGPPTIQFSGVPAGPSEGEKEGQKSVAQQNALDFQTVTKEAAGAPQALAQASFMRQEAPNFYTGPGAAYNQDLNKLLLVLDPTNPERANKVASYESFIKDAGYLSRAQAAAASSKAGVQELKMVASSMPSEETSQRGLDRVLGQVQGMQDYRLSKQIAQNQYVNQPGRGGWDNNGFEAQFNTTVSPYAFMYMRLSDQDRAEIRNQLAGSKAGQAELGRLQGQIKYITDNNLLPRQ